MRFDATRRRIEQLRQRVVLGIVCVNTLVEVIFISDVLWNHNQVSFVYAIALPMWSALAIIQTNRQIKPYTDLKATLKFLTRKRKSRRRLRSQLGMKVRVGGKRFTWGQTRDSGLSSKGKEEF